MPSFLFVLSLVFCVAFKAPIYSDISSFQNEFNHSTAKNIKEIAIMGERCSGSVYLQALLKKNFPECSISSTKFAHKHFYPWVHLTNFEIQLKEGFNSPQTDPDLNFLYGSSESLFVYIVKNPYDSLPLVYRQLALEDNEFIEWLTTPAWNYQRGKNKLYQFQNPYLGRLFNGYLELRTYNIMNYLQIGSLVGNFVFVRYEDLIKNPEAFVDFIAAHYSVNKKNSFESVANYKIEFIRSFFLNEKRIFSDEEIDQITQNLNWDVERLIGYRKRI
jgi:hypothetical protein